MAFFDPGVLRDGDLSLVPPTHGDAPAFLRSVGHPECRGEPGCVVRPEALRDLIDAAPLGRERLDPRQSGCTGAYRLWMKLDSRTVAGPNGTIAVEAPPVDFAGTITLRIGRGENVERYLGHLGYLVFPPARGRRLAERACRLLLPLARRHGLADLWITCNPDNPASRRTIERLGGLYAGTIDLPRRHPLYARGDRQKRRYRLPLSK